MRVLTERNVNDLYRTGIIELSMHGERQASRAGDVLVMPTPVTSVYKKPRERVLFDASRNANPFFHLFEGLWMLHGSDDVESLNVYVKDFGSRFAEKDGRIHGAYGARWRKEFGMNQLQVIIEKFKKNPDDRQCVLQMWDCRDEPISHEDGDVYNIGSNDLVGDWRDRPCNTHVYFRVRNLSDVEPKYPVLDMTILCRSNDIVWGAYGANAVHFSMLMEYIAAFVGVDVGTMYQVSNNYHAYVDVMKRLDEPSVHDPYYWEEVTPLPMVTDWTRWNEDLYSFMVWHGRERLKGDPKCPWNYSNEWFQNTAVPMVLAWWHWKQDDKVAALDIASSVVATDWRRAALEWFDRRIK